MVELRRSDAELIKFELPPEEFTRDFAANAHDGDLFVETRDD